LSLNGWYGQWLSGRNDLTHSKCGQRASRMAQAVRALCLASMKPWIQTPVLTKQNIAGHLWLMPVILATWEGKIKRIMVWSQPWQIVCYKNTWHKKGLEESLKWHLSGKSDPEFKPQYYHYQKKKMCLGDKMVSVAWIRAKGGQRPSKREPEALWCHKYALTFLTLGNSNKVNWPIGKDWMYTNAVCTHLSRLKLISKARHSYNILCFVFVSIWSYGTSNCQIYVLWITYFN
jgi:hypothetical protein